MGKLFHIELHFYYPHSWRSSDLLPHSLGERLPWITIITAIHTHTQLILWLLSCNGSSLLHPIAKTKCTCQYFIPKMCHVIEQC